LSSKTPAAGIMRVTLDASAPVLVDLYSSGYNFQVPVFTATGLGSGTHVAPRRVHGFEGTPARRAR